MKSRKLRSTVSNADRTSFDVSCVVLVVDDNGSGEGASSSWFNFFRQGIGNRMGSDIRNNVAVSTELYIKFLKLFSKKNSHVRKCKGKGR